MGKHATFEERQARAAADQGIDYTYFIQSGQDGPIKIGRATHPEKRLWGLQSNNPAFLKLLLLIPGGQIEPLLHSRFRHLRIHGEWFQGGAELTGYINCLKQHVLGTLEVSGETIPIAGLPEVSIPARVYGSRLRTTTGRLRNGDYDIDGMGPVQFHAVYGLMQLALNPHTGDFYHCVSTTGIRENIAKQQVPNSDDFSQFLD